MKLHLHSKSSFNSNSAQSFTPCNKSPKVTQTSLEETNPQFQLSKPPSQSQQTPDAYLKIFSENKRKHNVSLFNFFIDKHPRKSRQAYLKNEKQARSTKRQMQEGNFIIKKVKSSFPSLSSEKLKLLQVNTEQKLQKFIQKTEKNKQRLSPQKQFTDRNINKINENLSKNTKFDRKKYMYYRYRKKNSPQKNNTSLKEIPEINEVKRPRLSKTSFDQVNTKTEAVTQSFKQNESNNKRQELQYRYSFLGVFPSKNQSFSQAKCKLTIEPTQRLISYRLIDRKSLSQTSRQMRQRKQAEANSNIVFNQAIHFKPRKRIYPKNSQSRYNPEQQKHYKKEEQILGWNLGEQLQIEEQYFQF